MDLAATLADMTLRYFQKMGHPKPIKIKIIKKCPKLLRIYRIHCYSHQFLLPIITWLRISLVWKFMLRAMVGDGVWFIETFENDFVFVHLSTKYYKERCWLEFGSSLQIFLEYNSF